MAAAAAEIDTHSPHSQSPAECASADPRISIPKGLNTIARPAVIVN